MTLVGAQIFYNGHWVGRVVGDEVKPVSYSSSPQRVLTLNNGAKLRDVEQEIERARQLQRATGWEIRSTGDHHPDVRYDAGDGANYEARCACGFVAEHSWHWSRENAEEALEEHLKAIQWQWQGSGMKIGLVSCSGPKLDHAAMAKDLYQSDLFKFARAYAERHYDRWFIVSGFYGLVNPDAVIHPYERDLRTRSIAERMAWGRGVRATLNAEILPSEREVTTLYVHAGAVYRDAMDLESWRWNVRVPLEGLGIGQQLAWYKAESLLQLPG
jgi:hypothetical protein